MALILTNNATSKLAANINADATVVAIQSSDEAKFPLLSGGDWFPVTIVDSAGNMEIVRCTGRSGVNLTVTRAQENTTANSFTAGSRVDLRLTAGALAEINADYLDGQHGAFYRNASNLDAGTVPPARLPSTVLPTPVNADDDTDFNTLTSAGWQPNIYRGNNPNGPGESAYFHVENLVYTGGQITQLAISYASTANAVYIRGRYENAWSEWKRFARSDELSSLSADVAHLSGADFTGAVSGPSATFTAISSPSLDAKLAKASNLSDLPDKATARANLGANDASNLTTGTVDMARLSSDIARLSGSNFTGNIAVAGTSYFAGVSTFGPSGDHGPADARLLISGSGYYAYATADGSYARFGSNSAYRGVSLDIGNSSAMTIDASSKKASFAGLVSATGEVNISYTSDEDINIFGRRYSSLYSVITYGVRPSAVSTNFLSTTTASIARGALEIGDILRFSTTGESVITPGNTASLTARFTVAQNGDATIAGDLTVGGSTTTLNGGGGSLVAGVITSGGNRVSTHYGSTNDNQTNLPIGALVLMNASNTDNRNGSTSVYLVTGDPKLYSNGSSGTPLSGTWVSRGRTADGVMLAQRIA